MREFPRLDLVFQRGEAHPYHHWFAQGLTSPSQEARSLVNYFWNGKRYSKRPIYESVPKPALKVPVFTSKPDRPTITVPVQKPVARKVRRSRNIRRRRR